MRIKSKNQFIAINARLQAKATQTLSNYCIAAAAYTKRGNLLGMAINNVNNKMKHSRRGSGIHAERKLISCYGRKIAYIVLSRKGHSGADLPIHPCETCAKIIEKFGIKVILMHELLEKIDVN